MGPVATLVLWGTLLFELATPWLFSPTKGSWAPLPGEGAPNTGASAYAWVDVSRSGSELFLFGTARQGDSLVWVNGAFDLSAHRWIAFADEGLPQPRTDASLVWIGRELFLFGGRGPQGLLADGAVFNADTGRWRPMNMQGFTPLEEKFVSWTGSRLLVWGAKTTGALQSVGMLYDPRADVWSPMADIVTPVPSRVNVSAWTGSRQLYWGASSEFGCLSSGAFYAPETNSWEAVASLASPENCRSPIASWVGGRLFVWGGQSELARGEYRWVNTGGVYNEAERRWRPVSAENAPLIAGEDHRYRGAWFGDHFLLFELRETGSCAGFVYDLGTNQWRPVASSPEKSGERRYVLDRFTKQLTFTELGYDRETKSLTACRLLHLPPVDVSKVAHESLHEAGGDYVALWTVSPLAETGTGISRQ